MFCEEKGAAHVPIGNDATVPQSDGSARGEVTMTAKPPFQEHCGGETSSGCYVVADSTLKSERRSGQSTPPENPFDRNHDADASKNYLARLHTSSSLPKICPHPQGNPWPVKNAYLC